MSDKITVTINGEDYETEPGKMVLDVCRENDIFIPTLCEIEYIDEPFGGCRVCLVEAETDRGAQVTTSCDTPIQDGMKITTDTDEVQKGRKMAIELLLSEHTGDCVGPCSIECPASLDVQGYLAHIANERPREAVKLIKEKTPLALSLGRACFAPCEEECRREMVEEPLAIRQEKMYAAEYDIDDPWTPEIPEETGKSVGIVGGGPAGLTAAYFLRLKGHSVKIYDMMPELGGMMRYGIPNYRLPKDLLDKEIDWILNLGVEVETDTKMGEDIELEDLRDKHDAVFVATGAWDSWIIPIEGKELPGVMGGIDFLIDYSLGKELPVGDKVVVVGCGNTAMDVARTAKRMGKEVTIAYRRTLEQAPANEEEIEEAKEEGIDFVFLASPEKVCGCDEDGIEKVTCACMELGEPDESGRPKPIEIPDEKIDIEADSVILAIGQSPDLDLLENEGLEKDKYTLKANHKFQTNFDDVFTAGDALIGASSIVECTGQGREAAYALDAYLAETIDEYEVPDDFKIPFGYVHTDEITEEDLLDWNKVDRAEMPSRSPDERIKDFGKIELGFDKETAETEAERCLECGCLDRFECLLREYADMYGAEQHIYEGFKIEYDVDDTHPSVVREPSKCIQCGSCVRTSEEVHGKGVVQFANRGFETVVEPAFGDPLGEIDSELVGDLADACPTGAFEEVVNDVKPGPHETEKVGETRCVGCSLACPVEVRSVNGRPTMLKPAKDSTYQQHLCDIGKFETLGKKKARPIFNEDWDRIRDFLSENDVDIIVSRSITNDEIEKLQRISEKLGGRLTSKVNEKSSTESLDDLLTSKRIYLDEKVYKFAPIMRMFIQQAKDKGAELVNDIEDLNGGIAVLSPNSDVRAERMIVPYPGVNVQGLIEKNVTNGTSLTDTILVYGRNAIDVEELNGKKIIHMTDEYNEISENAEIVIPIRSWLENDGTVTNCFRQQMSMKSVVETDLPENIETIERINEML